MRIITASLDFLDELVPLFDAYRVFYKQDSNLSGVTAFLTERLQKKDSFIFLALDDQNKGLGFTQLYPSFSSVSMKPLYILNDLYVAENARNMGVGAELMEYAKYFTKEKGGKGLVLETALDNPAQKLYRRLGWIKDSAVNHYTWEV
ncbi:MAG: GNAT family N-acetyltransferase [Bacteroidota bacterium]